MQRLNVQRVLYLDADEYLLRLHFVRSIIQLKTNTPEILVLMFLTYLATSNKKGIFNTLNLNTWPENNLRLTLLSTYLYSFVWKDFPLQVGRYQ